MKEVSLHNSSAIEALPAMTTAAKVDKNYQRRRRLPAVATSRHPLPASCRLGNRCFDGHHVALVGFTKYEQSLRCVRVAIRVTPIPLNGLNPALV